MSMVRLFHAHTLLISPSNALLQSMRIEGMRDGEMDHLQIEEEQDRGQPSQSQPHHETVKCIFPFMRFVFSFSFFLIVSSEMLSDSPMGFCLCKLQLHMIFFTLSSMWLFSVLAYSSCNSIFHNIAIDLEWCCFSGN